ncbi:hypothetical protein KA005_69780, partial [bacterium]|nr:hypothetical protein [bacterium]
MECSEIVEKYLKENKYHGLFNVDYECACAVIDLGPCNEGIKADCSTGYIQAEEREGGLVIGAYHPKLCPECKTKIDFGSLG